MTDSFSRYSTLSQAFFRLVPTDLSPPQMVHQPTGATMDRPNPVHCADLRDLLLDKLDLFQLRERLHLLFYRKRLL